MNNVYLTGTAYRPKVKYTQNGKAVLSFSLGIYDSNSKNDNHMMYFNVTGFGKFVESINLKDREKVLVSGQLQQQQWTDKEVKKRSTVNVVTFYVKKLETSSRANEFESQLEAASYQSPDEDVPF